MTRQNRYPIDIDEYRDDRRFVMNLQPCGGGKWQLITYRNTGGLPGVRSDEFENFLAAEAYVKKWEPTVPLLSRGSEPLKLDHLATDESKHEEFVTWLHKRQLFSTLTLRRHCPFWHDSRGWTEKRMAVSVDREVTEIDGIEIEVTTTKPRLSEV